MNSSATVRVAAAKTLTVDQTAPTVFQGALNLNGTLATTGDSALEIQGAPVLGSGSALTVGNGSTLKFNVATAAAANVSIASGITATVATGATLELAGATSALVDVSASFSTGSDANPTQRVGIKNDGLLQVDTSAAQQVGAIYSDSLAGTVVLADNASLTADSINQGSLMIGDNSTFMLAPSNTDGSPMAGGFSLAGALALPNSLVDASGGLSGSAAIASPSIRVLLGGETTANAVPEPSTIVLTLGALLGMFAARRSGRRR
jgi:hypothetical protein